MASQIVSLAQVRKHLRIPDTFTDDDDLLTDVLIPAADGVMQRECAEMITRQWDEYYSGGDCTIWLRNIPVLSVELVQEGWGDINYDLTYVQVNTIGTSDEDFSFSVDMPDEGMISRRFAGNVVGPFAPGLSNIRVVYTTGVHDVPGPVVLAELELINHWYQAALQRHSGGPIDMYDAVASEYSTAQGQVNPFFGVPYRILELIKPEKRSPIIG